MTIKTLIALLLIGLLLSLFSGLIFLLRDQGSSKRTVWSLGIRLIFAVALMGVVIYGLYTKQLGSNAPWESNQYNTNVAPNSLNNINKKE